MVMERYRADISFGSDFGIGGGGITAISHLSYRRIGCHPMYDSQMHAASIAYSIQQAYKSCGTARAHTPPKDFWEGRIAGKCTSFNTTPPLRASGNPLGIGQSRRYALEALGGGARARHIEER
ncbi:uncharacterized protein TrAFT101_000784 [Trichoderma asperellum]|uniref:uncharacterized protein n=1 Tax=Trichoderma asperellum TaxID=101201 RepID=UPI00332A2C50|nr:hypothetical protein TrAFT101_000784 [Trichoderma asperellum]